MSSTDRPPHTGKHIGTSEETDPVGPTGRTNQVDRPFRAGGGLRTERGSKRVRAFLGGQVVLDTTRPLLVWERSAYPSYYIPVDDLVAVLAETGESARSPDGTEGRVHHLQVGEQVASSAATTFPDAQEPALLAHVRIAWGAVDAWFEEDEEVFVHPRNPYTRIDALRSTRHVVVEVAGVVVADSRSPVVLYETGIIPRYYLPVTDVRQELFVPSERITRCPYKGTANYLSLRAGELRVDDLAWTYPFPTRESLPIAGMVAFYDEQVDLTIDGVRRPRPDGPLLRPS